jgi:hypothetical protein
MANNGSEKIPKRRKKAAKRSLGVSQETRVLVLDRAKYRCEKCGVSLSDSFYYSLHHRTPRGMGGSREVRLNLPSNLVAVCGSGTTGCHGWIESNRIAAEDEGWLVSRYQEVAEVQVRLWRVGWRYLTDEGEYSSTPP